MAGGPNNSRWRASTAAALALAFAAGILPAATSPLDAADACVGGVQVGEIDGAALCTHGSHPPPAGIGLDKRPSTDELNRRRYGNRRGGRDQNGEHTYATTSSTSSYSSSATSIACIDDGASGNRVHAIYARAADAQDRYADVAPLIRRYAADADLAINMSAGERGEGRRVRFVHDNACKLTVDNVTLSNTGDDTFSNMVSELRSRGYDRRDRKYLVWVDAAVGICGLAQMYLDDRPGQENRNNSGAMFARVDAPCWGYAETHELLHTLGAVQQSAPHSTTGGHCWDVKDVMCYADSSTVTLESICPTASSKHVDCGHDDYFDPAPAPNSYLDRYWNTARNAFLEGAPALPPAPSLTVRAPSKAFAGNRFPVRAEVDIAEDRTYRVTWTTTRSDCRFVKKSGTSTSFYCPARSTGQGTITATVLDSLGLSTAVDRTFKLTVPSSPRRTVIRRRASSTLVSPGTPVVLKGKLRDYRTGKAVIGMPVAVYKKAAGATSWKKVTTKSTNRRGIAKVRVRPKQRVQYLFVSYSNKTWRSDQSKAITIRMR